jgi:hypothetical protein
MTYGKNGIHSFYIDAREVLKGGGKKGSPAGFSNPALR